MIKRLLVKKHLFVDMVLFTKIDFRAQGANILWPGCENVAVRAAMALKVARLRYLLTDIMFVRSQMQYLLTNIVFVRSKMQN